MLIKAVQGRLMWFRLPHTAQKTVCNSATVNLKNLMIMEIKINKSASADKMAAKAKEFSDKIVKKICALSEECAKEIVEKDITAKKQSDFIEKYFDENLRIGNKEVGINDINKPRFKRFYQRVYREIDRIFHPEDYPNEQ